MADDGSHVTTLDDDGNHVATLNPGTGQSVVLDHFYSWPTWLVRAQRGPGKELVCHLPQTNTPPTLSNVDSYDPEAEGGGREKLTAKKLDEVKALRQNAPAGKLVISKDTSRTPNLFGWAYNGIIRDEVPPDLGTGPKGSLEYARGQVWHELMNEGGVAAINAYDGAVLSWGQGWALVGGLLHTVLDPIFTKPAYGPLRKALLDRGIHWDAKQQAFSVINDDGYMETGPAALALIQGTPALLACLIDVGESQAEGLKDLLLKAETEAFLATPAAKVPPWALSWDDDLIRFVAHIGHGRSADAWKDQVGNSIKDFLLAWARRSKTGGKAAAFQEHGSGALRCKLSPIFVTWMQTWGSSESGRGHGIAWKAVSGVCPSPIMVSVAELDDPTNVTKFGGLLFFQAEAAEINDKKRKTSYYVYPSLPPGLSPDDDLYAFASRVNGLGMEAIITECEGVKKKLKVFSSLYNLEKSARTVQSYGFRTRVAIDAVLAHGVASVAEKDKATHALYTDPEFQRLPGDQQDVIRKYLKAKSDVWSFWDEGNAAGFLSHVNPYSMSALVATLGKRNYATVDKVRQAYEGEGKPFGWRLWIAIMAVLNRGGGQAAGWIATHPGYQELPGPQQAIIAKTVGLPYDASQYDPKG